MLRNVFLRTLRDQRRELAWWVVGLAAYVGYLLALYPTIRKSMAGLAQIYEQLPAAVRQAMLGTSGSLNFIGTPLGYLNLYVFAMLGPLLMMTFAIVTGSRAIPGEERRGTLELLLANPLPRWRVVGDKLAALVLATALLGAALWALLVLGTLSTGLDVSLRRLAEATFGMVLLGLVMGTLAFALGAVSGRRGLAAGVAVVVALGSYLFSSLAPVVEAMKPYRAASPYYWYSGDAGVLTQGLDPTRLAALVAAVAVLAVLAILGFQRRDLAT